MENEMPKTFSDTNDYFETLSDDPLLHICSFLSGKDLLKLSEVNKNFKRLITESVETMKKIPLVLISREGVDLSLAFDVVETRKFTALKLVAYSVGDKHQFGKLVLLFQLLSDSVEDFELQGVPPLDLFLTLMLILLPKLKRCHIMVGPMFSRSYAPVETISPHVKYLLESLTCHELFTVALLRYFSNCKQLKKFVTQSSRLLDAAEIEDISNFLAGQECLEVLDCDSKGLAWDRLTGYHQLRELRVNGSTDSGDGHKFASFLSQLSNLTKLDIRNYGIPSCTLLSAICKLPKLQKLTIQNKYDAVFKYEGEDEDEDESPLPRLVNQTVKELYIDDILTKLLPIFIGVDSIYFIAKAKFLDLSEIPLDTVAKIKLEKNLFGQQGPFSVRFSPVSIPTNVAQFSATVMKFAKEFSETIVKIEIGHASWDAAFRLPNSFCEELVNQFPRLKTLDLYNIEDRGKFSAFLRGNSFNPSLKKVNLHEPKEVAEPRWKKARLAIEWIDW